MKFKLKNKFLAPSPPQEEGSIDMKVDFCFSRFLKENSKHLEQAVWLIWKEGTLPIHDL